MNVKNKKLATEWFNRAESDLKYAIAGEKETAQHHVTCFLCHQSVEKALKALIVYSGNIPQRTHLLGRLVSMIEADFPAFKNLKMKIRKLDKFYIPARYPDDMRTDFVKQDARDALALAEEVVVLVKAILKD